MEGQEAGARLSPGREVEEGKEDVSMLTEYHLDVEHEVTHSKTHRNRSQ